MALDMELVKKLREQTGISILECKKAVEEAGGDLTKAAEILRKKGFEKAKAKSIAGDQSGRDRFLYPHERQDRRAGGSGL